MLNGLWAGMMMIGVLWGAFHGTLPEVTDGMLSSAKEAVTLCMTMLGILSFWSGILKVGEEAGLLEAMTKRMRPILKFLFPKLPADHPAAAHIAVNMIANMLGLGWAATPAGLQAMKELKKRDEEKHGFNKKGIASDEMCTFLIINISSLQLIPINMIAYRSQYGSTDPASVTGPILLATMISTLAGIVFVKLKQKNDNY